MSLSEQPVKGTITMSSVCGMKLTSLFDWYSNVWQIWNLLTLWSWRGWTAALRSLGTFLSALN